MAAHPALSALREIGVISDLAVDAVQASRAAAARPRATGRVRDTAGTLRANTPVTAVPATGTRIGGRALMLLSPPVQR